MKIKEKLNWKFRDLEGGLFADVTKADVGEGAGKLMEQGVDIMAWADPFFPDPSIPSSVRKAMTEAIEAGFASHYSMPIGQLPLREALARKIGRQTGLTLDPSRNIIVTPGSDSGLIYAMMPFIGEGDEVLIPDPSYPSNFLNAKLCGGRAVPVPLREADNYQLPIAEFEKRLTDRTRMVLLTHPNNPTTTVFRRENIEALCDFVKKHDLILVSDQAFEDHVFDDIDFVSPATIEGMWERTLTVCSISKGIGLSGFRIGYIYADDRIMDVLYGGAVNVLGAANTAASIGAIAALEDTGHLADVRRRLARRRKIAERAFSGIPGVRLNPIESGILCWLNVAALGSSERVADHILRKAGILVNAGTPYGAQGEGYLRIVYACFAEDDRAEAAYMRIRKALIDLGKETLQK